MGGNDTSTFNIDEILRNMERLLKGGGIKKEIDKNDARAVTISGIEGNVKSIKQKLYRDFLNINKDKDQVEDKDEDYNKLIRILSSIDTTNSSAIWEFPLKINSILESDPRRIATPYLGEFGCVVKNMKNILITFCYYYIKLDCNDIDMGHGVKHGRFIVRAYNKYDLNNNEIWNTFKI